MGISINDSLDLQANRPLDGRFGPFADIAEALASIPQFRRHKGLTLGILVNGKIIDYWFKFGVLDDDLIEKQPDILDGGNF
jgi:hypothetical protein